MSVGRGTYGFVSFGVDAVLLGSVVYEGHNM